MASEPLSDVAKQGWVRVRSRRVGLWQRRWLVLRRRTATSPLGSARLEKFRSEAAARRHAAYQADHRLESLQNAINNNNQHGGSTGSLNGIVNENNNNVNHDFRSQGNSQAAVKVCRLEGVVEMSRLPASVKTHAFQISFSDGTRKQFALDSDMEADSWVTCLSQECLPRGRGGGGGLSGRGIATGEPDLLSGGLAREMEEQFPVYLMPSPKLDAFGESLLQVTHENIYLWENVTVSGDNGDGGASGGARLAAWPLTALRRYGSDATKFTFEAGRHCATGEGLFIFHTAEGEAIYRKVHQATLAIAEAHHKLKTSGLHTIGSATAEKDNASSAVPPTSEVTLAALPSLPPSQLTSPTQRIISESTAPPIPPPRQSLSSTNNSKHISRRKERVLVDEHHLTPSLSYGTHGVDGAELFQEYEPSIV